MFQEPDCHEQTVEAAEYVNIYKLLFVFFNVADTFLANNWIASKLYNSQSSLENFEVKYSSNVFVVVFVVVVVDVKKQCRLRFKSLK